MLIDSGASSNTIGGVGDARNVISGNSQDGLDIRDSGTSGNVVTGNLIGTALGGVDALANTFTGIGIANGASNNTIGGTTNDDTNVISGNGTSGVSISDSGTTGNLVEGNFIGTNSSGTVAIANGQQGVLIENGASGNTIGGIANARNVISGNNGDGVDIQNSDTNENVVIGNDIGVTAGGSAAVANTQNGVGISGEPRTIRSADRPTARATSSPATALRASIFLERARPRTWSTATSSA